MDPDANLARQRNLQAKIAQLTAGSASRSVAELIEVGVELDQITDELCQLAGALDEWLSRGGHLPTAWAR